MTGENRMKKFSTQPTEVWKEYREGVSYNSVLDLYETVKRNENFFIGRQWEGVNAPDLPKPVMNILQRVINVFIAMIVSDDVAVSFAPHLPDPGIERICSILSFEVERVLEDAKARPKNREAVRNAAVDGDACIYPWFDPSAETGQAAKGRIRLDVIENINVIFGNPYSADAQAQPYIILAQRKPMEDVREEAEANGASKADIDNIRPDSDVNRDEKECGSGLCTVLIKLWRENGTVRALKTCEKATVKKAWDTGYKLYPVAYWNWEKVRSSYRGQAAITGLIQNQISVNRLFAMAILSVEMNAFPKIIYDSTKISGWTNRVGEAIKTIGSPSDAFASVFRGADMSPQVMEVVDRTVSMTRDFMGASDASLGNVKPDNTSAIIAVQQASEIPLELKRMGFYQFVEDYIRIIVDIMRADYGIRLVKAEVLDAPQRDASGTAYTVIPFDFSTLADLDLELRVDVGAAAYFSELMQIQTLDNLYEKGIITDPADYVRSIPDKYIKGKNKLIEKLKQRAGAAAPGGGEG
jgi:hypothetical protein